MDFNRKRNLNQLSCECKSNLSARAGKRSHNPHTVYPYEEKRKPLTLGGTDNGIDGCPVSGTRTLFQFSASM
jgi:hypothetical protein